MISERTTTIGRLRVRADVATAAGAEQRAGSALRALDLQPPAMPPQAILCIRALADPLPRSLDLRSSAARPATEWEAAVRRSTADLFRRAVRPVRGPMREDAEAVLFADRAELLACAARDALRGLLSSHWWWLYLLRTLSLDGIVREWRMEPAYIPAAMELLAASGEAVPFARRLDPPMALELALATLQAHGHDLLVRELVAMGSTPATTRTMVPTVVRGGLPPTVVSERECLHDLDAAVPIAPPLVASFLPEAFAMADAAAGQRLFLIVALTLRRAPSILRRGDAVVAFSQWLRAIGRAAVPVPIGVDEEIRDERRAGELRPTASTSPWLRSDTTPTSVEPAADTFTVATTTGTPERSQPEPTEPPTARSPSPAMTGVDVPPTPPALAEHSPEREAEGPTTIPSTEGAAARHEVPKAAAAGVRPVALTEAALHSQVAGTFFLLNAAIALGYYSDFTARTQEGCPLDPWHFLALVSRALLDPHDDLDADLDADPIWPLLRALAGDATVEMEPRQLEEMTGEIDRYVSSTLGAWLPDHGEEVAGWATSALLRRPGRIVLTPAHLDVHFNLADHPIAIRLSGLDRDPGWIPAAGRHVAFHFD